MATVAGSLVLEDVCTKEEWRVDTPSKAIFFDMIFEPDMADDE